MEYRYIGHPAVLWIRNRISKDPELFAGKVRPRSGSKHRAKWDPDKKKK
jgi:hypothetical protein